jgi:hypothetical protein
VASADGFYCFSAYSDLMRPPVPISSAHRFRGTSLANGHLDKDIDALMPWAYAQPAIASQ